MLHLPLNRHQGGIFKMLLRHLRRFWRQGRLHFEKFGEIDALTDWKTGSVALVDYDSHQMVPSIPSIYSTCRIIGIHPDTVCYKKTRRGWHIAVSFLERFEPAELICLQSILGDDPMRSALNLMRVREMARRHIPQFWKDRSNILYRRKL